MAALLQTALLAASPLLHLALGEGACALAARAVGASARPPSRAPELACLPPSRAPELACLYALGLLAHLAGAFALAAAGLPLPVASLLPLAPALVRVRPVLRALRGLRPSAGPASARGSPRGRARLALSRPWLAARFACGAPRDWNALAWVAVVTALGASLFTPEGGLATVWRNNWGDLAFHLGMISSFTFGGNLPPEYHVFAGERLSYPFLVNLWTAGLWWIDPTWPALWRLFVFQWVALWCAVYALLDGRRNPGLPWVLLFGGGSWAALGANSGERIAEGVAWTAFLPTIWVTQRAALLGACAALAALRFFLRALAEAEESPARRLSLASAGLVLGLSPLAHLHLCAVAGLWMLLVLAAQLPRSGRDLAALRGGKLAASRGRDPTTSRGRDLAAFAAFALPALLWLPWLAGKAQTVALARAWAAEAWLRDAPVWLALVGWLWWRTRRHDLFVPLALLFAAGNAVRLAVWDWDQIKVFLALYLITLAVWSATRGRAARLAQAACVLLALPGLLEARALFRGQPRVLYGPLELERARALREHTPPGAVIACAPRHAAFAALSGRRLFYGYEGTLWSHGIDFAARRERMLDLERLAACDLSVCPTHLVWTEDERRYFGRSHPGPGFAPTELDFLFAREGR